MPLTTRRIVINPPLTLSTLTYYLLLTVNIYRSFSFALRSKRIVISTILRAGGGNAWGHSVHRTGAVRRGGRLRRQAPHGACTAAAQRGERRRGGVATARALRQRSVASAGVAGGGGADDSSSADEARGRRRLRRRRAPRLRRRARPSRVRAFPRIAHDTRDEKV